MNKFVYSFNENCLNPMSLLGEKGTNLSEINKIGLPVPFGFTITTEACDVFFNEKNTLPQNIQDEIFEHIKNIEDIEGKELGSMINPLFLAVRTGAKERMPSMMENILMVGLNDETLLGLEKRVGSMDIAKKIYCKFILNYAQIVDKIDDYVFYQQYLKIYRLKENDCSFKNFLILGDLDTYKKVYTSIVGHQFEQNVKIQLQETIYASFSSWYSKRACIYRKIKEIPEDIYCAVTVQAVVLGNINDQSCILKLSSRDPIDGRNTISGNLIINKDGLYFDKLIKIQSVDDLKEYCPDTFEKIIKVTDILEKYFNEAQDIVFIIENGKIFVLQSQNSNMTANARLNTIIDMQKEGWIDVDEGLRRIEVDHIKQLLSPDIVDDGINNIIAKGEPLSTGVVTGKILFDFNDIKRHVFRGEDVIFVTDQLTSEHIAPIMLSTGIISIKRNMMLHMEAITSHLSKPYIAGIDSCEIVDNGKALLINGVKISSGEVISIDGSVGNIYKGEVLTVAPKLNYKYGKLMKWADNIRDLDLKLTLNSLAELPDYIEEDIEGIGLCRTERLFLEEYNQEIAKKLLLLKEKEERNKALNEFFINQKEDYKKIFLSSKDKTVSIRLLDPDLSTYLPDSVDELEILEKQLNVSSEQLSNRINRMKDLNPVLGQRGARALIDDPMVLRLQIKAIIEAAIDIQKELNIIVMPEILIPIVCDEDEIIHIKSIINELLEQANDVHNSNLKVSIGSMIETPRACLIADKIANNVDFVVFGMNDLTQMVYGCSSKDAIKMLFEYTNMGIFENNPFISIDITGVGSLIEIAINNIRRQKKSVKIGVAGNQTADPITLKYLYNLGVDFVTCEIEAIPIAKLVLAKETILKKNIQ
ncbi:MAG: PEP/pyruvate-binding domain-containing protein [Eubacteriales bacterium]|nr:PEP/pyruvate-binding domain-containing protein [Eubacteriales bacterium]MDY3332972.1 putative PEP-binding protein [Gallibacter sp.]